MPVPSGHVLAPGAILQVNGRRVQVRGVVQYREAGNHVTTLYELAGAKGASLEEEDGVWTLYREIPNGTVKRLRAGTVEAYRKQFALEGGYRCKVAAVAGEFDELPQLGAQETYKYYESEEYDLVHEVDDDAWYTGHELDSDNFKIVAAPGMSAWKRSRLEAGAGKAGQERQILWWSMLFAVLAIVIHNVSSSPAQNKRVYAGEFRTASTTEEPWETEPFLLEGRTSNVLAQVDTTLNNQWLDLELTLVDTRTGKWYQRQEGVEYFFGYEQGEYWTEGATAREIYFSSIPPGEYVLRAVDYADQPNVQYRVSLTRDVPRTRYLWAVLAIFMVLPIAMALQRMDR
jgi:hypothetical protein